MRASSAAASGLAVAGVLLVGVVVTVAATPPKPKVEPARGEQAFLQIARVLQSPRCQNCHPAGEAPLQTDAGAPHAMLVRRGPDGRGTSAMRCSNCHMGINNPEPQGPPGAPNWHLPPPETPMVFEGRTPDELCRTIKDPRQNGGKNIEQLVHHLTTDSLVLWGWNPGVGRTLPPLSQPEFARVVHEWAEAGAPCPVDHP
jgi:hypothetical protein